MTFDITLTNVITEKLTFVTVEDCVDMEDAINHVHKEFPNVVIEKIKEVK